MHFFQVCALLGMVTTNKVSHEGAFHNNQVYLNPIPIRSNLTKNLTNLKNKDKIDHKFAVNKVFLFILCLKQLEILILTRQYGRGDGAD